MKICVVSSAALPAPTGGSYGGLENIAGYAALEFARRGHQTTLITTQGSALHEMDIDAHGLQLMEVNEPSWENDSEAKHYRAYSEYIEEQFGSGEDSVVWDNTWACFTYMSKIKRKPKMNVLHTHHGMLGFADPPPVPYPCFIGVSKAHAALMSSQLGIPVRHAYNGINLPEPEDVAKATDGGYLLSLNRMSREKGVHNCIDLAKQTKIPLKVVGDDTKVADHKYVSDVIDRCKDSNGLCEYYGLVDADTKEELLRNCKAVIACPEIRWMEAFGLFAVEANAYGKPVLAVANGGLAEIVETGKNGFLSTTPQGLLNAIPRLGEIKPEDCIARAAEFTVEKMADQYLKLFTSCLEGDLW